jgi:hypothetical protein
MNDKKTISYLAITGKVSCGQIAIESGFLVGAGNAIFEGIMKRQKENWSEEQFVNWLVEIQYLYGKVSRTGITFRELYLKCFELINLFLKIEKTGA